MIRTARCTLILIVITLGVAINVFATGTIQSQFNTAYGTAGSALNSCSTCHTTTPATNSYGSDLATNIPNILNNSQIDFALIEPLDSDGDGFTNIAEINAGTFPGDATSIPVIANTPPVANAGPDQTVTEGATVTLNASNSSDPGGGITSYAWTQTGGPPVTLSSTTTILPTFIAPVAGATGASLTFSLTVTDTEGLQATDTCIVNIGAYLNQPPTANAGPDQTVNIGVTVSLNGSSSSDPDDGIASYLWTQPSGTPVTLSNPSVASPTFVSPSVGGGGDSLVFTLTVTDASGLVSRDSSIVNVTAVNLPPTADAGLAQMVIEGVTVTLDGSGSTDPDDGIAGYLWSQSGGLPVTLSDAAAVQPTFVTPAVDVGGTTLIFTLTVTDMGGLRATSQVSIQVSDNGIAGFPADALTTVTFAGEPFGITENNGGSFTRLEAMDPSAIPASTSKPQNMFFGLIDMEIRVASPGETTTVTVYLPTPLPPEQSWFKYTAAGGWIDYSAYAVLNATRDQITLTLTDGGPGDDDGVVNGVIVDPSGPGVAAPTSPSSSSSAVTTAGSGGGGGCFIAAAGIETMMESPVQRWTLFRDLLVRLGLMD